MRNSAHQYHQSLAHQNAKGQWRIQKVLEAVSSKSKSKSKDDSDNNVNHILLNNRNKSDGFVEFGALGKLRAA